MTDNLRGRVADVISHALDTWEPFGGTTEDIFVAQAIIDDLGLTVEEGHITGQGYGLPGVIGKRIVGKWEQG